MDAEFDLIFRNIGWDNNWSILEDGCKLLTLEFLCTLSFTKTYVSFRMFNEQYEFTWKEFSLRQGFLDACGVEIDELLSDFHREQF
jgi:hypothetical protein